MGAEAKAKGKKLAEEVFTDERLHTIVVLQRYDKPETVYGVHAYGDIDEDGSPALNTVGLLSPTMLEGFIEVVTGTYGWAFHPAVLVTDEHVKDYVLHNICPIEWHRWPEWDKRVYFYTRPGTQPKAPDDTAMRAKYGIGPEVIL